MHISLTTSRLNGFKKWSDQHPHDGKDDDQLSGATPAAIAEPSGGAVVALPHSTSAAE